MTLIGCLVASALIVAGKKPIKYGWCWYFEIGSGWGGVNLGPIFIVSRGASKTMKNHETGHGIQNIKYGVLMPFLVAIPSAIRYWYREIRRRIGKPCTTGYYDIWFEAEASKLGEQFMMRLKIDNLFVVP